MKWGLGSRIIELERQEAYERAMSRYRAEKAREQRRSTSRGSTSLGRGWRSISKAEAIALLIKRGHTRGAAKLAGRP